MQQPHYPCPRCGAPIYAGQAQCANCSLALDAESLRAWQAAQGPPPPPAYTGPAVAPPQFAPPQGPPPQFAPPQGPPPQFVPSQYAPPQFAPPPMTRPPRGRGWITAALVALVLGCVVCGGVAALSLGSQNQAQRASDAQATLTALAAQLTAAPQGLSQVDLATSGPGPTTTPRPDEADIQILDFTNYTDDQGNVIIIGQVANQGHALAHEIRVVGVGLDAAATPVASGSDLLLALVALPPGTKAPYQIRMPKPAGKIDRLRVHGTFKTYDPQAVHVFVPADGLTAANPQFTPGLAAQVSGQVQNGGKTTATQVQVLISGYDSTGQLVAVAQSAVTPATVPAGGTATFSVQFSGPNVADITKVEVLAAGNAAP